MRSHKMSESTRIAWQKVKHWWDVVICALAIFIFLRDWWPRWDGPCVDEEMWKILTPLAKDSLMASMAATSIFLPATIGIMAYLLRGQRRDIYVRDSVTELFYASVCFIVSLGIAIYIFLQLPVRLQKDLYITYDWILGTSAIIHFSSLALGIFKLFRGGYYLRRGLLAGLSVQNETAIKKEASQDKNNDTE